LNFMRTAIPPLLVGSSRPKLKMVRVDRSKEYKRPKKVSQYSNSSKIKRGQDYLEKLQIFDLLKTNFYNFLMCYKFCSYFVNYEFKVTIFFNIQKRYFWSANGNPALHHLQQFIFTFTRLVPRAHARARSR